MNSFKYKGVDLASTFEEDDFFFGFACLEDKVNVDPFLLLGM